jgi:hypothetical protein
MGKCALVSLFADSFAVKFTLFGFVAFGEDCVDLIFGF